MYGEIGATWTLPCEALVNTVYPALLDLIQEKNQRVIDERVI